MTYEDLKKFDSDRKGKNLIKKIRKVLYDFSYRDLKKEYPIDYDIIRKSIINYLYSVNFTLENDLDLNPDAELKLKTAIFKDYKKVIDNLEKIEEKSQELRDEIIRFKKIKSDAESNFDFKNHFYDAYLQNWHIINFAHNTFIGSIELVNYLLIYEAPPFSNDVKNYKDKYFLTSNKGNYASLIKTCFNSEDDVPKILKDNNVAYFDLIMGCLPIADEKKDDLRGKWCYKKEFKIGGKALPIVLFELGIYYVLTNAPRPIIKFPKIAIGAPVKTSRAIFEYYTDNPMKVLIQNKKLSDFLDPVKRKQLDICDFIFLPDVNIPIVKDCTEILSIDISGPNSINGFKKIKNGILLPLHKANIVSSANSPNGELLKNAYDNY